MPTLPLSLTTWLLVAAASILGVSTVFLNTILFMPQADMRLEPITGAITIGKTFTVDVIVESSIPVNVFHGDIVFNPEQLKIVSIDYNTSIADLWAERPWYSNGEGTMNFAGGTIKPGGFTGTGKLISLTFTTKQTGDTAITIANARILQHDGLGSDAILADPIDAVFSVNETSSTTKTVISKDPETRSFVIIPETMSTDLNGDGKQSIADTSIFMTDLVSQNLRSDFNLDGKVTIADMSILMQVK